MIYCNGCLHFFSRAERRTSSEGEPYSCCPFCGDDDIEDADKCQKCGTLYTSETLDEYEGLCPECAKETVDIFRAFLNTLSEPQRAYLNKFYEGEEIV